MVIYFIQLSSPNRNDRTESNQLRFIAVSEAFGAEEVKVGILEKA